MFIRLWVLSNHLNPIMTTTNDNGKFHRKLQFMYL